MTFNSFYNLLLHLSENKWKPPAEYWESLPSYSNTRFSSQFFFKETLLYFLTPFYSIFPNKLLKLAPVNVLQYLECAMCWSTAALEACLKQFPYSFCRLRHMTQHSRAEALKFCLKTISVLSWTDLLAFVHGLGNWSHWVWKNNVKHMTSNSS